VKHWIYKTHIELVIKCSLTTHVDSLKFMHITDTPCGLWPRLSRFFNRRRFSRGESGSMSNFTLLRMSDDDTANVSELCIRLGSQFITVSSISICLTIYYGHSTSTVASEIRYNRRRLKTITDDYSRFTDGCSKCKTCCCWPTSNHISHDPRRFKAPFQRRI